MITNKHIIEALDSFRADKKKSIQELTEGIMSTRTYTRLLNFEADISIDDLVKMLEKLNTPFEEFINFINMHASVVSNNEEQFVNVVIYENYTKAMNMYDDVVTSGEYKSRFGDKTIPACIAFLNYVNKKITLDAARVIIKDLLKLDNIKKAKVIHGYDLYILYLYVKIAPKNEINEIGDFMYNVYNDKTFHVFSQLYEVAAMLVFIIMLYVFTSQPYSEDNDKKIKAILKDALEFNRIATISPYDILIFELMYKYLKKNNIENKYITFYYISSILATSNNDFLRGRTFEIEETDVEKYYELIKDARFINSSMYKRILNEL